jgi:hypothetical protein
MVVLMAFWFQWTWKWEDDLISRPQVRSHRLSPEDHTHNELIGFKTIINCGQYDRRSILWSDQHLSRSRLLDVSMFIWPDSMNQVNVRPADHPMNFNDLDFVEFLLFHFSTKLWNQPFWLHNLFFNGNKIENVSKWLTFRYFLPNLLLFRDSYTTVTKEWFKVEEQSSSKTTERNADRMMERMGKRKWKCHCWSLELKQQGNDIKDSDKRRKTTGEVFKFTKPKHRNENRQKLRKSIVRNCE